MTISNTPSVIASPMGGTGDYPVQSTTRPFSNQYNNGECTIRSTSRRSAGNIDSIYVAGAMAKSAVSRSGAHYITLPGKMQRRQLPFSFAGTVRVAPSSPNQSFVASQELFWGVGTPTGARSECFGISERRSSSYAIISSSGLGSTEHNRKTRSCPMYWEPSPGVFIPILVPNYASTTAALRETIPPRSLFLSLSSSSGSPCPLHGLNPKRAREAHKARTSLEFSGVDHATVVITYLAGSPSMIK